MSVFGVLEELRNRPIGDQAPLRAARKGFRQRIPIIRDNALFGEAVIEARRPGLQGENFYASTRNPPYWHRVEGATDKLWLRKSVAEKLARVNGRIAAAGLELFVFDAWRPREVQAYFHDVWMPRELQRRDPSSDRRGADRGSGTLLGRAVGQRRTRPRPMPPRRRWI